MHTASMDTGRPEPLLYSREVPTLLAKTVAPDDVLDAVLDENLVEAVIDVIRNHAPIENALLHSDPFGLLARAITFVSLIHENCGLDPSRPAYFKCEVPDPMGEFDPVDVLRDFGARSELFFDTLSVYTQWYPTSDHSTWYKKAEATPEFDDAQRGIRFRHALGELLRPKFEIVASGLILPSELAGSAPSIESPAYHLLRGADWPEVVSKIGEAQREMEEGHFADAVTDAGTALEAAFARVGCSGKTLGERVRAAQRKVFSGPDTQLGEAAERIAKFVASVRNVRGDAHAGSSASQSDAELVFRVALALIMWLAEIHPEGQGTNQPL